MNTAYKRQQPHENDQPLNGWMLTLTDLLVLLLGFFVLQYSMLLPSGALTKTQRVEQTAVASPSVAAIEINVDRTASDIAFAVQQHNVALEIKRDRKEITVQFSSPMFFAKSTELSLHGTETVRALAHSLSWRPVRMEIETHTDSDLPEAFPSNWELTSAQALVIARQMIDAGFPAERISTVAYSDSRPFIRDQFGPPRHLNRRVELHVLYEEET